MVKASGSLLEFPDHVEAPDYERPGDGDRLERLGGQVTLLGIVLAALARLDEVLGVGEGGRPVEAMPEGLSHEGSWRRVVPIDATVDVEEQLPPIL